MSSIFHFFTDLANKREVLSDPKIKLEQFPFDKNLLSLRQAGKFPDMAIRVNKPRPENLLLRGGELLELKETKSYGIASFNSTIPTGMKNIANIPNLRDKMAENGDPPGAFLERDIYYLLRGRSKGNAKVCLVHGSFFETLKVDELISLAFRQALESAPGEDLSEAEKEKISRILSKQNLFSTSRRVEKASVSLRFRIMTEVRKEANILKNYPQIKDNTLNFIAPAHGKAEDKRDAEGRAYAAAMETADAPQGNEFFIKHPFNGYFWARQLRLFP